VDNYIFFCIRCEYLKQFHETRKEWYQVFAKDGMHQSGGCLWFGGISPVTGQLEERNEDCLQLLIDLSGSLPRSVHNKQFSCCIQDIDTLSHEAGIIWELVKDQPFLLSTLYIGFIWNIEQKLVYLSSQKVNKYLIAIHKWRKHHSHILQDIQQLYGKLLHTCVAVPQGRAYLTSLEGMLAYCRDKPFMP
jgi:hypothetical protein